MVCKSRFVRLAAFIGLFVLAPTVSAAIFIVNNTNDVPDAIPGNGGCNPVNMVGQNCTLRAAIMEANALAGVDNIVVASGTYSLSRLGANEDGADTGDLDITEDVEIINGTNNPPLINGNFSDRIFDVHAGATLTLTNVDMTFGLANQVNTRHGGAIRVNGNGTLQLNESTISNSIANFGGAIYSDGVVIIVDSEFFNNAITDDGVLQGAAVGAAIRNRGQLSTDRSTFRNNGTMALADDLGITLVSTAYAIDSGVGGVVPNPVVTMVNSTVYNNTAGLFSDQVPTALVSTSIVGNGFRGLRFLQSNAPGIQLYIERTVIASHTSDCNGLDSANMAFSIAGNFNASSDATCGFDGVVDNDNVGYPFFGPLDTYGGRTPVLMPTPNGPLVDQAGQGCVAEDQRGVNRTIEGIDGNLNGSKSCDIGAVEYNPATDPVLPPDIFSDGFEDI